MRKDGYTFLELIVFVTVTIIFILLLAPAAWKIYEASSMARSANNIRVLMAGAMQYLADNDHRFWSFCEARKTIIDADGNEVRGSRWWFGFESDSSKSRGEGRRSFDPEQGPLGGYVPKYLRPDPAFASQGRSFKPKYKSGYLGIAYNVVLAGGWVASKRTKPLSYWELSNPAHVVVFATSAQVNTFQLPASTEHPMIEEFYGIDEREKTVHFRHGGQAFVGFADGSCGFLPMDESTRDNRMPEANIGRFAPSGSFEYLK